jgi:uncharacterized protein (UPF0548 family)
MLHRSEDTVVLKVHGISEAGTVFMACKCKVLKVYNMKHMVSVATTPTPCVTSQPMLHRSEDTVVLKVHGVLEAGTVFMACKCKVLKIFSMKHVVSVTTAITTTTYGGG